MIEQYNDWTAGLRGELEFWRLFRSYHPALFASGMDPASPLDADVDDALNGAVPRILDLGCGMISSMGRKSKQGRVLDIRYADALAPEFYDIAREQGFALPYKIDKAHAEGLSLVYSPGMFDVIYCRNALDHCYSPVDALRSLPVFLADQGTLVLKHYRNCADLNGKSGLHQWNLFDHDSRLWLERNRQRWCVDEMLTGCRQVALRRYSEEWGTAMLDMVCAIYRKDRP